MLKSEQVDYDSESTASHLFSSELATISMAKRLKSSELHDTYNRAGEQILEGQKLKE